MPLYQSILYQQMWAWRYEQFKLWGMRWRLGARLQVLMGYRNS